MSQVYLRTPMVQLATGLAISALAAVGLTATPPGTPRGAGASSSSSEPVANRFLHASAFKALKAAYRADIKEMKRPLPLGLAHAQVLADLLEIKVEIYSLKAGARVTKYGPAIEPVLTINEHYRAGFIDYFLLLQNGNYSVLAAREEDEPSQYSTWAKLKQKVAGQFVEVGESASSGSGYAMVPKNGNSLITALYFIAKEEFPNREETASMRASVAENLAVAAIRNELHDMITHLLTDVAGTPWEKDRFRGYGPRTSALLAENPAFRAAREGALQPSRPQLDLESEEETVDAGPDPAPPSALAAQATLASAAGAPSKPPCPSGVEADRPQDGPGSQAVPAFAQDAGAQAGLERNAVPASASPFQPTPEGACDPSPRLPSPPPNPAPAPPPPAHSDLTACASTPESPRRPASPATSSAAPGAPQAFSGAVLFNHFKQLQEHGQLSPMPPMPAQAPLPAPSPSAPALAPSNQPQVLAAPVADQGAAPSAPGATLLDAFQHPQIQELVFATGATGALDALAIDSVIFTNSEALESFGRALGRCAPLKSISFSSWYYVGDLNKLLDYMVKERELQSLSLRGIWLSALNIPALSRVLATSGNLTELDLSNNQLQIQDLDELSFNMLNSPNAISHLKVSANPFNGGQNSLYFETWLATRPTLRSLDMAGCSMGDRLALNIVLALCDHPAVESLNLSNNNITNKGGLALAGLVRANRSLKHLDLSGNLFGEGAFKQLLAAIQEHPALVTVCLFSADPGSAPFQQAADQILDSRNPAGTAPASTSLGGS